MLDEAIASVTAQTLGEWELCLVDDGSSDPEVLAALERHARSDARIKLMRHDTPRGISQATNTAMAQATGDYIALLDHDDTLAPDALDHVARRIAAEPGLDMIYTDEDTLVDGRQVWAHLKPGWSPDTLRTNGYTCHLGVYRRALVQELGGFRSDFDGSQDVDMILRLTERSDRIAHIPRILYHWRAHADSTAADAQSKPYAYVAARNAITSHLGRIGVPAQVDFGPPGLYRVTHRVEPSTSIALVLAVQDIGGLADAAASWPLQAHPSWTVTLAVPPDALDAATGALTDAGIPGERITAIPAPAGQHPSAALAAAADAATAEHLLLMQAPAMGLTHDWLTRLLGYSAQPGIAAAGPVILAPDGRIHQAGIAIPEGIPLHLLHGAHSSMDELFGYGTSVYNVSAVSGILATRRETYHQLGGLDPAYGELALIDYCLRAGQDAPTHRHRPRRPPAHHRTRPHHQRPARDLASAPSLGQNPQPRPLLQPQLPHRPRRLPAGRGGLTWPSQRSAAPRRACTEPRLRPASGSLSRRCATASTPHRRALSGSFIPTASSDASCRCPPAPPSRIRSRRRAISASPAGPCSFRMIGAISLAPSAPR